MFQHSRNVSSTVKRATLLSSTTTSLCVTGSRCLARGNADGKSPHIPPMSQKLEHNVSAPPPTPSGRGAGRKVVFGVGVALSAAAAGGALLLFDPLGLVTEKKSLAPAPHLVKKNVENSTVIVPQSTTRRSPSEDKVVSDVEKKPHSKEVVALSMSAAPVADKDNINNNSSIGMVAENTVQMLLSGKRTPEETKMMDERQKQVELDLENRLKVKLEQEKAQRDAEEAKLLSQQRKEQAEVERRKFYEETKGKKNKELAHTLSRQVSEALELLQSAATLNRLVGDLHKERAQLLRKALDASDDAVAQQYWPRIDELRKESMHRISDAMASTSVLKNMLKDVFDEIAAARTDEMTSGNLVLDSYEEQAKHIALELDNSLHQRESANPTGEVMKQRYNAMQEEMELLEKELKNLPDFKPGKSGERFSGEELRELVKFAHQRVSQLRSELVELECMRDLRLKEGLEEQKVKLDVDSKQRLQEELANQRLEYKRKLDEELTTLAEQDDKKVRDELARQGLAKANHATDMLKLQEDKLYVEGKANVEDQVQSEKAALTESLGDSLVKLEKLRSHAHERADVDEVVSNIQQLFSTARTFQLALELPATGDAEEGDYKLIDISEAIASCKELVPDDTFVQTILSSLSTQALTTGIYTLTSLENRFSSVYAECKRNALFPTSENIFYSSLSRLYGKLLLFTVTPRYDNVSDFYVNGIEGMDAKDLLVQAEHFMSRGHVAEAVKCMVQLKGLPRQLAQDWISEALLCLEVHQASDAIMCYALSRSFSQIL